MKMTRNALERAAKDLLQIPPLIFRSVRRAIAMTTVIDTDLDLNVSHQQFEVIVLLDEEGTLQVAEIGRRLQIAKAQMTQVMDKLSDLGLIERKTNPEDRRAINVSLSERGRTVLEANKVRLRNAVKETMEALSDEDLAELSASLRRVQDIMALIDRK
jgi:MarR family 2-MHQ and catechol resistance regulon transcriptional repressor